MVAESVRWLIAIGPREESRREQNFTAILQRGSIKFVPLTRAPRCVVRVAPISEKLAVLL